MRDLPRDGREHLAVVAAVDDEPDPPEAAAALGPEERPRPLARQDDALVLQAGEDAVDDVAPDLEPPRQCELAREPHPGGELPRADLRAKTFVKVILFAAHAADILPNPRPRRKLVRTSFF